MSEKTEQKPEIVISNKCGGKRCSDYDDECVLVRCPAKCFIGDSLTGPADGYCPLIHTPN